MTARVRRSPTSRIAAPAFALAVGTTLTGCVPDTQTDAKEGARRHVGWNIDTALTCLQDAAPELRSDLGPAVLAETLMPCGGTTFFNHDDEAIRTVDPLASKNGALVVSGSPVDEQLTLRIVTAGSALAEAGRSRTRALAATCWQVLVDLESYTVGEPSGSTCNEALIERENPTEVVPSEKARPDHAG